MSETKHVYQAICDVAGEMAREGISKDRKNQQQGYAFRGIDDVYNALAAVMAKYKLCILPRAISRDQVERQTKQGGALFYTAVHVEYDFVSAVDGSSHTCCMFGEAMDSADKSTNKAMSAAYKYLAMQAFCIPTEGDNDSDATTHGSIEAANAVRDAKLAELRQQVPLPKAATPPAGAKPAAKAAPSARNFELLQAFKGLKEQLGEQEYYRILNKHGFAKSTEIGTVEKGREIYREMVEVAKAKKDAEEPKQ